MEVATSSKEGVFVLRKEPMMAWILSANKPNMNNIPASIMMIKEMALDFSVPTIPFFSCKPMPQICSSEFLITLKSVVATNKKNTKLNKVTYHF